MARALRSDVPDRLRFTAGGLVDDALRPVALRGISLFWSQWKGEFFNEMLVRWLADDWHIDVIRIPVAAASPGYLSDPDGQTGLACRVIDAAIANRIYAVLDWHGHDPFTRQARSLFGTIARRYRDCPNILYESWNEPGPEYSWKTDIAHHHMAVIETVREWAPNAPFIVGTPNFCLAPDVAARAPLPYENLAYSFHFYAATHRGELRLKVANALAEGVALFATEWGAGDASGGGEVDKRSTKRWLSFLNANAIGHINWSVTDKEEACAALLAGASPNGGWKRRELSSSGRLVRSYLRRQRRIGRPLP